MYCSNLPEQIRQTIEAREISRSENFGNAVAYLERLGWTNRAAVDAIQSGMMVVKMNAWTQSFGDVSGSRGHQTLLVKNGNYSKVRELAKEFAQACGVRRCDVTMDGWNQNQNVMYL